MLQVEHNKRIYEIPLKPGIYKIEDPSIVYGGCFWVAHDGQKALYIPGSGPKTTNLSDITSSPLWRVASQIVDKKVKVGR